MLPRKVGVFFELCNYANQQVCQFAYMYACLKLCKYASMKVCKHGMVVTVEIFEIVDKSVMQMYINFKLIQTQCVCLTWWTCISSTTTCKIFGFLGRGIVTKVFLGWHSGNPLHTISLSSCVQVPLDMKVSRDCLDSTLLRRVGCETSKAQVVSPMTAILMNIACTLVF